MGNPVFHQLPTVGGREQSADEQKRKCAAMPPENIEVYLDALQTTAEALLDIIANLRAELDYHE